MNANVSEAVTATGEARPTSSLSKRLIVVAAIAAVTFVAALFSTGLTLASQTGNRPTVGSPAPDFEMTLYPKYRAGLPETMHLSDLRGGTSSSEGKVVVINFWASWCVKCRKEAADLEATYRDYQKNGVAFLGVDYLDTEAAALRYLAEFDTTYANGVDVQQKIARAYRITGVPETFIVDRQGIIRHVATQRMTSAELKAALDPQVAN